jgi:signal transduction histidine kinase
LERAELDEAQRRQLRGQALAEVDRLGLLTDKVLMATRAEEGVLALELGAVEVMGLLRGVVDRALARPGCSHRITLQGPDRLEVRSDEQALRSVAENLVENAVKYTPAATTVSVEVRRGRDGWQLTVADEGAGIPVTERERIFEKFHRGGNEETRRTKGTGLGLYIVHRLVQRLGGTIQVQDRQPHGAIFAASFPLR